MGYLPSMIWIETHDRSSREGRIEHSPETKTPNLITLKQPKSGYHFLWNELSPCHLADLGSSNNAMFMLLYRLQTDVIRNSNVLLNATPKAILGSLFIKHHVSGHFLKTSLPLFKFLSKSCFYNRSIPLKCHYYVSLQTCLLINRLLLQYLWLEISSTDASSTIR
jgi:hypothetical protein